MPDVRLSDYDPAAPPVRAGDRVRLRPAAGWHAADDGARPVACEYRERGGAARRLYWSAELDRRAGADLAVLGFGPSGLPRLAPDGAGGGGWELHPDWLDVPDPAGGPCVCDLRAVLMVAGCRCGRIGREREARR